MASFLERPIGEMDLEELVRLMKQVISSEVPPIPAGLLKLGDLDNPLVPPDGAVTSDALVYNGETGKWENGRITADSLEAELILGGTIIAGDPESTHVALGTVDHDGPMVGLHAFASDGMTVTFMLDATGGDIFMSGRVQFGDSFLLPAENAIEFQELTTGGYLTPSRVQSGSSGSVSGSTTATCAWPVTTTSGNTLVMHLYIWDADNAVPVPSTPAGWTLSASAIAPDSDSACYLYTRVASTPRTSESITLNDTCAWQHTVYEYANVDGVDVIEDEEGTQTSGGADLPDDFSITTTFANTMIVAMTAATFETTPGASIAVSFRPFTGSLDDDTNFRGNSIGSQPVGWKGLVYSFELNPSVTGTYTHATGGLEYYAPGPETLVNCTWMQVGVALKTRVETGSPYTPDAGKFKLFAREGSSAVPAIKTQAGETLDLSMQKISATAPTNPLDGQIWLYRGSIGDAGAFTWQFCYNSSGGTYKWEFVGGPPVTHYLVSTASTSSTTNVDLGSGPTLTMPFAGVYEVSYGAMMNADNAGDDNDRALLALVANGTEVDLVGTQGTDRSGATIRSESASGRMLCTLAAAAQIIKLQYRVEAAANADFLQRYITITPVKIA